MQRIGTPLKCPDLNLQPEETKGIQLSADMQQVLSLLTAYWKNKRILVKASPTGAMFSSSPEAENCYHVTATSDNFAYTGDNIPCTEVLVMGHPNNAGLVWVHPKSAAGTTKSWPLAKTDAVGITLTNLNMLHLLIASDTEKAIIMYTI
jgi:hypothetical protein